MTTETGGKQKAPDGAQRPDEVARKLAQAAMQATCRAMHTAQLAVDAAAPGGNAALRGAMEVLRDGITDAYAAIPERTRAEILRAPGTIGGDELLDLLATLVRARESRTQDNNGATIALPQQLGE